MLKGSDLLVRALENEGVDRIFGVPGEENLDVVESLRNSSIELVITRHEQAAAFMAATYGRLTGKPGVCIATLGPGALNFTTGSAYALLGAMPMVMLTGQKGILTSRQARFQIVDIVGTFKPLTKLSRQIVSGVQIPTLVRDAFRTALLRGSALPVSWTGWPRLPPFETGARLSVVGTAPPPIVLGGKIGGAALHWRALPSSIAPGYDRALQDQCRYNQCRSPSPHP
jgi:Thiamine pyrophosphate enzyme, N-terminal TPP binding domain